MNRRGTVIFTLFNLPLRLWENFFFSFFLIWRRLRGLWVHSTSYFNCEFSQISRTVVLKLTLNKPNQHTMIEADRRYVWFIDAVDLRALYAFFLSIFALLLRDALQHFTVHSDLASSLSLSNLRTFLTLHTLSQCNREKIVGKILFSTRYNCPIWGWRAEGEKNNGSFAFARVLTEKYCQTRACPMCARLELNQARSSREGNYCWSAKKRANRFRDQRSRLMLNRNWHDSTWKNPGSTKYFCF